jgi:hypothetical protein
MNEYISDQDIHNRFINIKPIAFTGVNNFVIKEVKEIEFKKERDELFDRFIKGWNRERHMVGIKPISPKRLAIAINSNPFLKKDDGALRDLVFHCEKVGNYKKAQWILFPKKK